MDAGVPVALRHRADRPRSSRTAGSSASGSPATARTATIRARRGVILGSGGFEKNLEMREKYQPHPTSVDWTTGSEFNTGGGILAGIAAGAETDLLDDAWWGPTIPLPNGPWFCLAERNLPGSIIVNQAGQRFMNEALPYVEAVHEIYEGEATGVGHVPAGWSSTSATATATCSPASRRASRSRAAGTSTAPSRRPPSLEALAAEIDVPADALHGDGRALQRLRADRRRRGLPPRRERLRQVLLRPDGEAEPVAAHHRPRAVLRRQDRARRPRHQGRPGHRRARPGAAAGRLGHRRACTPPATSPSAVMGHTYAGPGATIGPALVFGYLAAEDIAHTRRSRSTASSQARPPDADRPDAAIGAHVGTASFSWTESDVLLYHLAHRRRLPSGRQRAPRRAALHHRGRRACRCCRRSASWCRRSTRPTRRRWTCPAATSTWPRSCTARSRSPCTDRCRPPAPRPSRTTLTDVWDKGKAAVIWQEGVATSESGEELWTTRSSIFVRGEGGWGGDRGTVRAGRAARPRARRRHDVRRHARSRRCSTGSAATATRCTPTPTSPRRPASPRRSCTGSAPTGSCCASSPTRCSAATRPGSAASRSSSPAWSSRARRCGCAAGCEDGRIVGCGHGRRRR